MIDKLNHYSFTTPASIHDEEALTALELAGRTGAKMNEVIDEVNKFESNVTNTVTEHQEVIDGVPEMVSDEVLKLKEVGTFDEAINKRLKQSMYGTVSVGAKITLTQDGTATAGGLLVKFPNKISLWKPEGENGTTKEWSDITTGLSDVYINGDKCDIEVQYGCGLYYEVTSNKLIMCPPSYAYINMICLIINRYGRAVGGCLFDEYMSYVEDTTDTINTQVANNYTTYKSTEYAFIYAGNDNDVVIEDGASGALSVTIPANLTLLSAPSNNGTSIVTADCIDSILPYAVVKNDGTIRVNIPYRSALFYNLSTGKFGVSPLSYCYPGLIIMVNNIYSNAVSGCLIDEINAKDKKLNTLVSNFESDVKLAEFASVVNNSSENSERIMFFTDPHTVYGVDWEKRTSTHIDYIKRLFDSSACDIIIDGGDWLTDSQTAQDASHALGFIKSQWTGYPHKLVIGNHDTNYQGEERLSQSGINNLAFAGKSYYSFETDNTLFIVVDTQTDNATLNSEDYKKEQMTFVKDVMLANTKQHIIIIGHILFANESDNASKTVFDFMYEIVNFASKFNRRVGYTPSLIGSYVNMANCTGYVECVMGGHLHTDYTGTTMSIPYILTKNNDFTNPAIDLINIDYDNRLITIKRVGDGSDRTYTLPTLTTTTNDAELTVGTGEMQQEVI